MSHSQKKYFIPEDPLQMSIDSILENEKMDRKIVSEIEKINKLYQEFKKIVESKDEEEQFIYKRKVRLFKNMQSRLIRISLGKIDNTDIEYIKNKINEYEEIGLVGAGVSRRKTAVNVSDYMIYTGTGAKFVTMFWLGLTISFAKAAALVGIIFPPILYGFIAIKAIFDASSKAYLLRANSVAVNNRLAEQQEAYDLIASESSQIVRALAALASFVFNLAACVAFAGVLLGTAFPLIPIWFLTAAAGWAFVAGASASGWVSDAYVPAKRAEKRYLKCKMAFDKVRDEIEKLNATIDRQHNRDEFEKKLGRLRVQYQLLHNKYSKLKKDYLSKSANAKWGLRGVLAVALIACAAIPVVGHIIAIVGYLIFAAVGIRSAYVAIKQHYSKSKEVPMNESLYEDLGFAHQTKQLTSDALTRKMLKEPEGEIEKGHDLSEQPVPTVDRGSKYKVPSILGESKTEKNEGEISKDKKPDQRHEVR